MEDNFNDIQRSQENCSITHYQKLHEIAKHGISASSVPEPDIEEDAEDGGVPLSIFCDKDANEWWKEGVERSDVSPEDSILYNESDKKVGFWLRLRRDGKIIGKKRYMWGDNMMDLMILAGTLAFGRRLRDQNNSLWEIELCDAALRIFEMFIEALMKEDLDMCDSVKSMMAYRSGYIRGKVSDASDVYTIFKCIEEGVDLDTANDYDDEED